MFGRRLFRQRYWARWSASPAQAVTSEKRASIDGSVDVAHEIRLDRRGEGLVQQMGEDPTSRNVEYGKVALDELERVERSISHLLKYAKEEDYNLTRVNVATVVDSALTQMHAKLDEARVLVARNYISGPTITADAEKLRQVFANVLDNAIDALTPVAEGRRIELYIENGRPDYATVRVVDNGAGIPADKIGRIFNPFFTTKEKGRAWHGNLAEIVEAHEERSTWLAKSDRH